MTSAIIENIKFQGDFFNLKEIEELELLLIGCRHNNKDIVERMSDLTIEDYINKTSLEELVAGMF